MSVSKIIFVCHKFFTCKMQEDNDLLDLVNKVNTFID
jgi:hypothetical protein